MAAKKGDKVQILYTGTFDDGTVFDSSEKHGNEPLEFEVGSGMVIPGFEDGVIGMKVGEEKEIKIQPAEGYGEAKPELIKKVPRDKFPAKEEPKAGMNLVIGLPNGMQIPAKIVDVSSKEVTLDLNHPMAGKVLNFKIKLVKIV